VIENLSDFLISLLPSKWWFYPAFLIFSVVFGVLLILIMSLFRKKDKNNKLSIDDLIKISSNPKAKEKDLLGALIAYNENFRIKNEEKKSLKFLEQILKHKNRSKKIFDFIHNEIVKNNEEYKKILDEMEKKALNS
jgi:hypothetical protein